MTQTATHDIQLNFIGPAGEIMGLLVASTRGQATADNLKAFFGQCLAPGWEMEVTVSEPSRFSPKKEGWP